MSGPLARWGGHGRATGARDVGGAVRGGWGQSDCVE
jgi:hypothetical protein